MGIGHIALVFDGANEKTVALEKSANQDNERGDQPDPAIEERIMAEENTVMKEKIEAVEKSANAKIEAVQKAATEALETLKKAHDVEKAAQDKVIQDMKDAKALDGWVQKSTTDLSHYPGKNAAELGKMLCDLEKISPETAKTTFETMKSASDSLKASDMLKAVGSSASGMVGSALDKINVLVDGVVAKSADVSREKAFVQIITKNPALYREYLNEHPEQIKG